MMVLSSTSWTIAAKKMKGASPTTTTLTTTWTRNPWLDLPTTTTWMSIVQPILAWLEIDCVVSNPLALNGRSSTKWSGIMTSNGIKCLPDSCPIKNWRNIAWCPNDIHPTWNCKLYLVCVCVSRNISIWYSYEYTYIVHQRMLSHNIYLYSSYTTVALGFTHSVFNTEN